VNQVQRSQGRRVALHGESAGGQRRGEASDHLNPSGLSDPLRLPRGGAIPARVREPMERSFGASLDSVRLSEAPELASAGLEAVARGDDILFAPGRLDLDSKQGLALLGHELTHVLQQRAGRVRSEGGINADAALEVEANRHGGLAAEGLRIPPPSLGPAPAQPAAPAPAQAKGPFKALKQLFGNQQEPRLLTDDDLTSPLTKDGIQLGSLNEDVVRGEFREALDGDAQHHGFYKPQTGKLNDPAYRSRIRAPGKTPDYNARAAELPTRAVASSELDQALGTNVVARSYHATLQKEDGYVSAQADGRAVTDKKNPGVNFSDPNTQRGLADLQLNDFITNQVDRHAGNIFIDGESGKVTGIDNDLSFGKQNKTGMGSAIGTNRGLPTQVDRQSAQRVTDMTPDQLQKLLKSSGRGDEQLSPEEIAAAQQRLAELQGHIQQGLDVEGNPGAAPEGFTGPSIINEWNEDTYNDAMTAGNEESLLAFAKTEWDKKAVERTEYQLEERQPQQPWGDGQAQPDAPRQMNALEQHGPPAQQDGRQWQDGRRRQDDRRWQRGQVANNT